MEPSKPLGRRKTSIFDVTLPGTSPGLPTPDTETAPGTSPGAPPRARTSVFDQTLPGVQAPGTRKPGFFTRLFSRQGTPSPAAEAAALESQERDPAPLPSRLRTSVFEQTLPGLEVPAPVPEPVQAEAVPAPLASTELKMDSDEWDEEGTSVEWNPRWNAAPVPAPAGVEPPPTPVRSFRRLWQIAAGVVVLACLAAAFLLWPQKPSEAPLPVESMPPALQGYHTRAMGGDVAAMRMLGLSYCYGVHGPANVPEGVKWLKRAAKTGNTTARTELANMGLQVD